LILWTSEITRSGILKTTPVFYAKKEGETMYISNLSKERIKTIIYDNSNNIFIDSIERPPQSIFCLECNEKSDSECYSLEYCVKIQTGILLISEPLTFDLRDLEQGIENSEMQAVIEVFEMLSENAKTLLYQVNRRFNTSVKLSSTEGVLRLHSFIQNSAPQSDLLKNIQSMIVVLDQLYQCEMAGW
jgi:hypothetical protein